MKAWPMCREVLPRPMFAGDVCDACAERYDVYGVYFCLG